MDASPGLPAFTGQPARVDARFEGEIHGPVAVENYGLQIGSNRGVVINLASGDRPTVQPKPAPVAIRGRRFNRAELLDRGAETAAAAAALREFQPVELYGESGVGKTTLLRYCAWAATPDVTAGVLSYRPRQEPAETLDDVLQYVFEQFFDTSMPLKLVRTGESRRYLNDLSAFVLLDDVGLAADDVRSLLEALPACALVLAGARAHLSRGEGRPIAVKGLPPDAALAVLERELGRPLAATEVPLATEICQVLGGRAEALVGLAREMEAGADDNPTLDAFLERLRADPSGEVLTRLGLARLAEPEQKALSTLVALSGASVRAEHVGAIAGIPDPGPALGALVQRQLAEEDGEGYRASAAALAVLPDALRVRPIAGGAEDAASRSAPWDVLPWVERALAHWLAWAEAGRAAVSVAREDVDAVMRALSRAAELQRWEVIGRLGRAIEDALIVSGRWGAWEQDLSWMLEAARTLGNRAAEAYVLHQLGSRALCLGDVGVARLQLEEALRIRRALRDRDGAETTRHNLGLLRPRRRRLAWLLGSILLVLGLTAGVARAVPGGGAFPRASLGVTPTPDGIDLIAGGGMLSPVVMATRQTHKVSTRTSRVSPTSTTVPTDDASDPRGPVDTRVATAVAGATSVATDTPRPSAPPSPTSGGVRAATAIATRPPPRTPVDIPTFARTAMATPTFAATATTTLAATAAASRTVGACAGDEQFSFSTANPIAGQTFVATVTSAQGPSNVSLSESPSDHPTGPGTGSAGGLHTWSWQVTPATSGRRDFYFFVDGALCTTNFVVVAPSPTPTSTPTSSPTPTPTFTAVATATKVPTATFTPTATSTPTATFTPIATFTPTATLIPTATFAPTATFTPTATPCPRLANPTIAAIVLTNGTQTSVTWGSTGGCAPYGGTIAAQYLQNGPGTTGTTQSQTYAIKAGSGSIVDTPPPSICWMTIVYTLNLQDSSGQTVSASTSVDWCSVVG